MRSMLLGVFVVSTAFTLCAQSPSRLDEPLPSEFRIASPRNLPPCAPGASSRSPIFLAVIQIARQANVLLGFENTPDCWMSGGLYTGAKREVLTGMSARQAFDYLMTVMPEYSWKEMDGVVVVRPKAAWDDPKDPLNFTTGPFDTTQEPTLDDVLHTVVHAVTPDVFPLGHEDLHALGRPIDRPVAVTFAGGTMLEALNAVIRARGNLDWEFAGHQGWLIALTQLDSRGGYVGISLNTPPRQGNVRRQ